MSYKELQSEKLDNITEPENKDREEEETDETESKPKEPPSFHYQECSIKW